MFFFKDTATTEIYPLSLHDALPISLGGLLVVGQYLLFLLGREVGEKPEPLALLHHVRGVLVDLTPYGQSLLEQRSEEHTSELQSRQYLVCRLLLEKNKQALSIRLAS